MPARAPPKQRRRLTSPEHRPRLYRGGLVADMQRVLAMDEHTGTFRAAPRTNAVRVLPLPDLDPEAASEAEVDIKYAGYIAKAERRAQDAQRLAGLHIPPGTDFSGLHGLSNEVRERLQAAQPATLGQAARLPGVTAAAVSATASAAEGGASGSGGGGGSSMRSMFARSPALNAPLLKPGWGWYQANCWKTVSCSGEGERRPRRA